MKNLVLLFIILFNTIISFGQTYELSAQLTSGLFYFSGTTTTSTTYLVADNPSGPYWTDNPYGRGSGYSYGGCIQFQAISKTNVIFGLQLGYESLSSKVKISDVFGESRASAILTKSKSILTSDFINFHPFIGLRIPIKEFAFDFSAGFDLGFCVMSKENGETDVATGTTISNDNDINKPVVDGRPRFDFTVYFKNIGISTGYSYGITNYSGSGIGYSNGAYSRLIRFGIICKLYKK